MKTTLCVVGAAVAISFFSVGCTSTVDRFAQRCDQAEGSAGDRARRAPRRVHVEDAAGALTPSPRS